MDVVGEPRRPRNHDDGLLRCLFVIVMIFKILLNRRALHSLDCLIDDCGLMRVFVLTGAVVAVRVDRVRPSRAEGRPSKKLTRQKHTQAITTSPPPSATFIATTVPHVSAC
jgi:hypothetical protein